MIIIPLGNDIRAEVIDSVLGQLSDGIWENSNGMRKYWYYADVNRDNELEVNDENWDSGFRGKDEAWVRNWFANKAKQVVKIWADDYGKRDVWQRDNQDEVDYMGGHKVRDIKVADVYNCYDYLKQRKGKYNYGKVEEEVIPEPEIASTPNVSSPKVSGGMRPSQQDLEDFFTGASTKIRGLRRIMAADDEEFEDPRIDELDDLQGRVEDDFDYVMTGIERLGREGMLDEAIELLNTLADTLDSAIGIIGNDFESGSDINPEEEI